MNPGLGRLLVKDPSGTEREIEISDTPFRIGRQGDGDLVLLDSRISRRHAQIVEADDGFEIEDLGSRHGIYVNGNRQLRHRLTTGDQISFGVTEGYEITFLMKAPELPGLLEKLQTAKSSRAPELQHLSLLLQMAKMLSRAPVLEEVLTTLVDSALRVTSADRGLLFLCDETKRLKLRLARTKEREYISLDIDDYSKSVVNQVAETGREEMLIEEEGTGRAPMETAVSGRGLRGVLALPLQHLPMVEVAGETIRSSAPELLGVLYLDNQSRPTSLSGLDRQVLQSLAAEGATVIENTRLLRVAREQERIQRELMLARNIQQRLLPSQLPTGDYFELRAVTVPCHTVGGDYYDAVRLPRSRIGLTVADVSGKGVPAAMLASSLQGAFGAVAAGDPELADLFARVNAFIFDRTPPEMYATLFYGVLEPSGQFAFVNAGHPDSLLLTKEGKVRLLHSENFPVGIVAGAAFSVGSEKLKPGDLVVVYSDGVTEASNRAGDFFGEERLIQVLESRGRGDADAVLAAVTDAVKEFVSSAPASDDFTLIVLEYRPE